MPKIASFKPKQIQKILLKNGFIIKRQEGSHRTFYNIETEKITVVPIHSKDIPIGTLKSIIKQSGLSEDIFRK